jgi:integrase
MRREATGEVRFIGGIWTCRVRTFGKREPFDLPTCTDRVEAVARATLLSSVARRFKLAKTHEPQAMEALRCIAGASTKALTDAVRAAEMLLGGEIPVAGQPKALTFQQAGEWWTSGGARRDFPDHVEEITQEHRDGSAARLTRAVYPVIGDRPIAELTRADCDAVMRQIPVVKGRKELSRSTRRQYALLMTRIFGLAELAGYIERSPLPRGWAPRPNDDKRFPIMYPAEDRAFLGTTTIPLWARLYFGYLHREGGRRSEAVALRRGAIDSAHQTVTLDVNKTDHSRPWKLAPGVVEALETSFARRGGVKPADRVFVDENGGAVNVDHLADKLRRWMQGAALDRGDLYTEGPNKGQFGTHCFRRSFVTRSLALGKNEDFVRQRTGHKSDELLKYRQASKGFAELDLGDVDPLVLCIPELSPIQGIETMLRELCVAIHDEPTVNAPGGTDAALEAPTHCPTIAPKMVGAAGFEPTTLRPPV